MRTAHVQSNGGEWTVVWHSPHDEPPGEAQGATAVCLTDSDELVIDARQG
jgi:hypothetical protein